MPCHRRSLLKGLQLLLAAQSIEAGPIRWMPREVVAIRAYNETIPSNANTSAVPIATTSSDAAAAEATTAAASVAQNGNAGSSQGTVPGSIFSTVSVNSPNSDAATNTVIDGPRPETTETVPKPTLHSQASTAVQNSTTAEQATQPTSILSTVLTPELPAGTKASSGENKPVDSTTGSLETQTAASSGTEALTSGSVSVSIISSTVLPVGPSPLPSSQSVVLPSKLPSNFGTYTSPNKIASPSSQNSPQAGSTAPVLFSTPASNGPVPHETETSNSSVQQAPVPTTIPEASKHQETQRIISFTAEPGSSLPSVPAAAPAGSGSKDRSKLQSTMNLGGLKPSTAPGEGALVSTAAPQKTEAPVATPPTTGAPADQTSAASAPAAAPQRTSASSIPVAGPEQPSATSTPAAAPQQTTALAGGQTPYETSAAAGGTTIAQSLISPGNSAAPGVSSVAAPATPGPSSASPTPSSAPVPGAAQTTVKPVIGPGVPTMKPMPTATSTINSATYQKNLEQAHKYNNIYAFLTTDAACAGSQVVCIDGKFGTCGADGKYALSSCGANSKCFALPMTTTEGVKVVCEDAATAAKILGSSNDGGAASSPAATTSVAAGKPKTRPPPVTLTTRITVKPKQRPASKDPKEVQPSSTLEQQPTNPVATISNQQSASGAPQQQPTENVSTILHQKPTGSVPGASSQKPSEPVQTVSHKQPTSQAPVRTQAPEHTTYVSSEPKPDRTSAPEASEPTSKKQSPGHTVSNSIKRPGDGGATDSNPKPTAAPKPDASSKKPKATSELPTTVDLVPIDDSTTTKPPAAAATKVKPAKIATHSKSDDSSTGSKNGSNNGNNGASEIAHGSAHSTTEIVNGTPTVSVFFTVTVTEHDAQKQTETVTVTETHKEKVTVVLSA